MRIRINILSLLRSLVKIAAQVAAVGELVIAAHEQVSSSAASSQDQSLDLDAVRTPPADNSSSAPAAPSAFPNDPSAAH